MRIQSCFWLQIREGIRVVPAKPPLLLPGKALHFLFSKTSLNRPSLFVNNFSSVEMNIFLTDFDFVIDGLKVNIFFVAAEMDFKGKDLTAHIASKISCFKVNSFDVPVQL